MDDQSLFDSYDNQKVPSGKPGKVSDDPWSKKRSIDSDFDDFHIPPKRPNLFEDVKPEIQETADDKRVIVPAGKIFFLLFKNFQLLLHYFLYFLNSQFLSPKYFKYFSTF